MRLVNAVATTTTVVEATSGPGTAPLTIWPCGPTRDIERPPLRRADRRPAAAPLGCCAAVASAWSPALPHPPRCPGLLPRRCKATFRAPPCRADHRPARTPRRHRHGSRCSRLGPVAGRATVPSLATAPAAPPPSHRCSARGRETKKGERESERASFSLCALSSLRATKSFCCAVVTTKNGRNGVEGVIKFDDGIKGGSYFLMAQRQAPSFLMAHREKPLFTYR